MTASSRYTTPTTMIMAASAAMISFGSAEAVQKTPLAKTSVSSAKQQSFGKVRAEDSGVSFMNALDESHPLTRLYFSGFGCGSVTMADFNGDQKNDLFFSGGAKQNGLYLQKETSWTFTDHTKESGLESNLWNSGSAAVDIDQDGDQDLILCAYDKPPQLLINDGTGKFIDVAKESGFGESDSFLMPTFSDYDRDGDLDLFFVTNQLYRAGGRPADPPVEKGADGQLRVKPEFDRYYRIKVDSEGKLRINDTGRPNYLYRNDSTRGELKFTNVSQEAGITDWGFGLSATWFDYNNDGWPDLHVGNDFSEPDRLYLNLKNGTFRDVAKNAFPTSAWFSMGADSADINNDGLDDLFCADMAFTTHYKQKVGMGQMGAKQALLERIQPLQVMRNHLFINSGFGRFSEAAQLAGLAKSDWTWAVRFEDFDLDGKQDLFVTNGAIRSFNHADYEVSNATGKTKWERWKNTPPRPEANLIFRNMGDYRFGNKSKEWGLDEVNVSHGMACGDLDGDGDSDLVVTNAGGVVSLFKNNTQSKRVIISLDNPVSEGARFELIEGVISQRRTLRTAGGYYTTSSPEIAFSLKGKAELKITWPDGSFQEVSGLEPGFHYRIKKDSEKQTDQPAQKAIFGPPALIKEASHLEMIFDDFAKQPLLPHKLSQLGPASATGDIDGDGDLDFFLGGASGRSGSLFLNTSSGLSKIPTSAFDSHSDFEDVAAVFFDADQDGDPDLYLASGSYEDDASDPLLKDRLYLNDGKGKFTHSPKALPELRDVGSCVRPCDIDQDGDLDLFVGSRVIPGAYPLSSSSRLLINNQGSFTDQTKKRALGLQNSGMVTDAIWADVNGDKLPDLMVVSEWGSPQLFLNQNGTLIENTKSAKLADLTGWWTRISAADLDQDGDLDFAVGNFGLNTKYHASPEKPALIYYGDFQGTGQKHLVEAEFEDDTLFPIRGKSCSTAAMPALSKKFNSYHSFALAELNDIYDLKKSDRYDCKVLESGFLINDGEGEFSFRAMPRLAQISPIQGLVFTDISNDGSPDLIIAQNFYNPQFETGPYSGGIGLLLKNDGKGDFTELSPKQSGILLPGDPRGLHHFDITGDSLPDLICPLNNGPLLWQRRKPISK